MSITHIVTTTLERLGRFDAAVTAWAEAPLTEADYVSALYLDLRSGGISIAEVAPHGGHVIGWPVPPLDEAGQIALLEELVPLARSAAASYVPTADVLADDDIDEQTDRHLAAIHRVVVRAATRHERSVHGRWASAPAIHELHPASV